MFEVVSPDAKSRERDYVKKRAEYHATRRPRIRHHRPDRPAR